MKNIISVDKKWINKEKKYWDEFYQKKKIPKKDGLSKSVTGNRLYPREKYLFSFLRQRITGKKLLEVGCGDVTTVKQLLDPEKYKYSYYGIDVSEEAIKIASQKIKGRFLVASIEENPFNKEKFDVILCLGVLHHTKSKEKLLIDLSKLLKPDGFLVINEPFERPGFLGKLFRRLLFFVNESKHEERLNEVKLLNNIKKIGKIIFMKKEYSPIRTLMVLFFGKLMEKSLVLTNLILMIDDLVIKSLGSIFSIFNGGGIFLIIQKNTN